MLATNNEYLSEASQTLFELNADEIAREKSRARDDMRKLKNSIDRKIAQLEQALSEKDQVLAEQAQALAEKDAENARLRALLATKETQ